MEKIHKSFIRSQEKIAKSHDITFRFEPTPYVKLNGSPARGYFDEDGKEIVVATGKKIQEWFPVFVHETCHMDQYIEGSKYFTPALRGNKGGVYDPYQIYEMYVEGLVDLSPVNYKKVVTGAISVEWDCEKRAIQKIKDHELPINVLDYTKRSNLYCYTWAYSAEIRRWYNMIGLERRNKKIVEVMPSKMLKTPKDYLEIPYEIRVEYEISIDKLNKMNYNKKMKSEGQPVGNGDSLES